MMPTAEKRRGLLLLFLLVPLFWSSPEPTCAHESQPGSLGIVQIAEDRYQLTWRAPIYYGKPHPAQLVLPEEWQTLGTPTQRRRPDAIVFQRLISTNGENIQGSVLRFPGLESTITDVFVRLSRLDGTEMTAVASPTKPYVTLRGDRPWYQTAGEYLQLGFNHILLGVDHLLFVLGLLLIVSGRMRLVKTITSFTIAHSITLGMATLGYASVPTPPLNAAIALSILFLGPEIIRSYRGESSLTIRYPWLIAFAFGLLHGFGFASGLSTSGMPKGEIPWALLWFNIGVELGQLLFVFIIVALIKSFVTLEIRWPRWSRYLPAYSVGGLGAYWTIQRTVLIVGGL